MAATQALILAAGTAQRLMPLTEGRPKGMLIVGGKPLLQHAIEALADSGVDQVVVVVGHHGEKIQSFFKDGREFGVKIAYAHQANPSGTLPALRMALPHLDASRPLLVLPGHAFVTRDLLKPLASATETTVLLATAGDAHVQGVPAVRGDRLAGMRHEAPQIGSTRVTTNILVAGPQFVTAVQAGTLEGHADIDLALGAWAGSGAVVKTVQATLPWHVVVGPWDVLRLNEWVLSQGVGETSKVKGARGPVHVGRNTTIAPTAVLVGPVTIGDGCTIEDHCVIGPYVAIRNGTLVGAHCEIRRSILNNNVAVDSGALLRGCILDDGAQVGAHVVCAETPTPTGPRGCIVGRDAFIPAGTVLPGGTVLATESRPG